jgi:hypothetical protein
MGASAFHAFSEQRPGPDHDDIDDAIEDAAETGTRSILDISEIGATPDFATAAPLRPSRLQALFGTTTPTRAQIEACDELFDDIERGHCVYVIAHDTAGRPIEIFFAGYSYD